MIGPQKRSYLCQGTLVLPFTLQLTKNENGLNAI